MEFTKGYLDLRTTIISPPLVSSLKKVTLSSIHYRNLQVLAVQTFKVKNNISSEIIMNLFMFREPPCNIEEALSY